MSASTDNSPQLIELDPRRRTTVRVGEHSRYLVQQEPDGTLIWRPAVVVSEEELRLLQRPDILDAIDKSRRRTEEGHTGASAPVRRRKAG